jgi:hypothetical protein
MFSGGKTQSQINLSEAESCTRVVSSGKTSRRQMRGRNASDGQLSKSVILSHQIPASHRIILDEDNGYHTGFQGVSIP